MHIGILRVAICGLLVLGCGKTIMGEKEMWYRMAEAIIVNF